MPVSIRYRFSQSFTVPPKEAYLWCTDFTNQDHQFMGHDNAERQVIPVSDDIVILKDIFRTSNGVVKKQKLVHLYPDILCWVSTHITGPNKHSQFRYQIVPQDGGSRLDCEALHVENQNDLPLKEVARLAEVLCSEDSSAWKLLALAMAKEL